MQGEIGLRECLASIVLFDLRDEEPYAYYMLTITRPTSYRRRPRLYDLQPDVEIEKLNGRINRSTQAINGFRNLRCYAVNSGAALCITGFCLATTHLSIMNSPSKPVFWIAALFTLGPSAFPAYSAATITKHGAENLYLRAKRKYIQFNLAS